MRRPLLLALAATLAATLLPTAAAQAGPDSRERAWVSIGDSFISGEGGRWRGNTNNPLNIDTDRAYEGFSLFSGRVLNPARVYVDGSWSSRCHRSDVAEIIGAAAGSGATPVNLACSGVESKGVISASIPGFESFKGESSQVDRLGQVARDKNVKVVVVSIGGNDLRFPEIIEDCVQGNLLAPMVVMLCSVSQGAQMDTRMPLVLSNVRRVLDNVKATMKARGYDRDDYRLILQSYPSPVPRAADLEEDADSHRIFFGCPFNDPDLDWARDGLVPRLAANLRAAADAEDVEFLDLQDLFEGHEVCSRHTVLQNDDDDADRDISWMRWLSVDSTQESFHPNAVGQKALGRCLRTLIDRPEGREWRCTAGPHVDPANVRLAELRGKPVKIAKQRPGYTELPPHPLDDAPDLTRADIDRAAAATGQPVAPRVGDQAPDPNAPAGLDPAAAPVAGR